MHELQDSERPEPICQTTYPEIHPDPLSEACVSSPVLRNKRLPGILVDRHAEIETVRELLQEHRVVTVTGAAGQGKTVFAHLASVEMHENYPDGAVFVDLEQMSDAALVTQEIAVAFGLWEEPGQSLEHTMITGLREKQILLILDHCDGLHSGCAQLFSTLYSLCSRLHLLTTSREPLDLDFAENFALPSLSLPPITNGPADPLSPDELERSDAARLFLEQARRRNPQIRATSAVCEAISALCHRLDGIPLAVTLVAARSRSLPIEEILPLLSNASLVSMERSEALNSMPRALFAAIDWTFSLLNLKQKRLLGRLSIFAGGWDLEAAESICADTRDEFLRNPKWKVGPIEVREILRTLVDKSLVICTERTGSARYHLQPAIRQYAVVKRRQANENGWLQRRHSLYFLQFAETAGLYLQTPDRAAWHDRLETERSNFRAALDSTLETLAERAPLHLIETEERILRLAVALEDYWTIRGHYAEGKYYLKAALASPGAHESPLPGANALDAAGRLARLQGVNREATSCFEQSLAIRRRIGDRKGAARALEALGGIFREEGDYRRAAAFEREACLLSRSAMKRSKAADSWEHPDSAPAEPLGTRGLGAATAAALKRELLFDRTIAEALHSIGNAALERGDLTAATACLSDCLPLWKKLGNMKCVVEVLESMARIACFEDRGEWAVCLYATARCLRSRLVVECTSAGEADRNHTQTWLMQRLSEEDRARLLDPTEAIPLESILARANLTVGRIAGTAAVGSTEVMQPSGNQ